MFHLTREPISVDRIMGSVRSTKAGAIVLFSGESRDHNDGRGVDRLEYEAYEGLAEKLIHEILSEAIRRWSLHGAACIHRLGTVPLSESAVVVATSASHRREAYEANRYIIDRVKAEVPIWKKEFFADGSIAWGENRPETPSSES